ncbi:MAG: DNA alkylation repair protein [Planctomycetes bacterium]|nr:DNA alkylation repair protein [Planctomycetota bacterium]
MDGIVTEIRDTLVRAGSAEVRAHSDHFFKKDEEIDPYGVKNAEIKAIAKSAAMRLADSPKADVLAICDELWRGKYEEMVIACELAYSRRDEFVQADMRRFDRWLDDHVRNWAVCDTLCNHCVGAIVEKYPKLLATLRKWTRSPHRWKKRGAAVSLILPARKGLFLADIFRIADALLPDPDHMVQKGYGWLLKAASEAHQDAVYDYVVSHRHDMPRTAYRYALEKMPRERRAEAMKK